MLAPIMIALLGVLLGGAALYFSLTGSGDTNQAQTDLEAITAKAEGLETRIRDLEAKYTDQASKLSSLEQQIRLMARDTQGALNQVGVEINRNREQIGQSADKLTELIETLNRSGRPAALPPAPERTAATEAATARLPVATVPDRPPVEEAASAPVVIAPAAKVHTIRAGDTFTKLSQQYSISVAAILAANPDVDPRRLAVGQKIKIPGQ